MGMMIRRAVKRIREAESATAPKEAVNNPDVQKVQEQSSVTTKRGRKGKR